MILKQTNVLCRPASLLTSNISISVHISLVSRGPAKKISVRAYGLHFKGEDSQVFRNDGYSVNHNRFPSHKNGKLSLEIRKTPYDHSIKTRKPSVPPGLLSREPQPRVHNQQQTDRPLPHLQVARASCCTQHCRCGLSDSAMYLTSCHLCNTQLKIQPIKD